MADPHLKLKRGDDELIPGDHIAPDDEHENALRVQIPAFAKGETVQVSIGWYAATLENYGASFYVIAEAVDRSLVGTWEGPEFEHASNR